MIIKSNILYTRKSNEKARLVSAAREKVKKFSDEEFTVLIAAHVEHFMESFKFVNLPKTNPKWEEVILPQKSSHSYETQSNQLFC